MTAATATDAPSGRHAPAVHARLSFFGVLKAEWIKLLSLRSTWWTLAITVVVMVLFGLLQASSIQFMMEDEQLAAIASNMHGAEVATSGYFFAVVTVAVLGALMFTGEYSTGMIRSTLAAVPTRLPVMAAKAIAIVVVSVLTSAVGIAGAHVATIPMLNEYDLVPALDDETTWQIYGGTAFFFVAVALFALGLGALLRSTAGAITAVLGIMILLPMVLSFFNQDWVQDIAAFLPLNAAGAFLSPSGAADAGTAAMDAGIDLTAWEGVGVVGAWAVLALILGSIVLRRRDA